MSVNNRLNEFSMKIVQMILQFTIWNDFKYVIDHFFKCD